MAIYSFCLKFGKNFYFVYRICITEKGKTGQEKGKRKINCQNEQYRFKNAIIFAIIWHIKVKKGRIWNVKEEIHLGEINLIEEVDENMPILSLSVTSLDIQVEEGRVYKGSFFVESENKVPIQGTVCSTNDKIGTEIQQLEGIRQEIPYFFKGKLALAGDLFEGSLVLITNGGEYRIPYRIEVVPRSMDSSRGRISSIEDFMKIYAGNRKEAMELFFLPAFEEVFLKDLPRQQALYHSLMKSRSRSLIMEEFLTAAGYKEAVRLDVPKKKLVLEGEDDQAELELFLGTEGYLEGKLSCEKGQLKLSHTVFTSDDFTDGRMVVTVKKNPNRIRGNDVIHIETVRYHFEIPVEWWGQQPTVSKNREEQIRIKKQRAELMHNYLSFRTGGIGFEDFAQEANQALEELYHLTGDREWKLYRIHSYLMEEHPEEAKEIMEEFADASVIEELTPLERQYFLYLQAMYYRTPETITKAVTSIREFYEVSECKAEALWMLIYLDREYVYNKRLQYDTIRQLFEEGNNSSLLYFEACEILNDNPNYMEELGEFEISIFRWGVRYGYISLALSYQFSRLALKMKYYNKAVCYIAKTLYKVEPDERYLQVICSLFIKGNRIGKEYHEYYRLAVEANLKIIGLNEFFIRSMDFHRFDVIPRRVLIYFTYSNSLDYLEKAYLYTNVLKNKDSYEEVYGAYYSKMIPFVEEQLSKGRINEHLAYLYTFFQKEVLEKPDYGKAVCDVLFFRPLTCKNPYITGVYVSCPETGMEKYYPLSGGTSCVEIYNSNTILYFVDNSEQRYVGNIDYELGEFLSTTQFTTEWIRQNLTNQKILLMESGKMKETIREETLPVLRRIVFNDDFTEWMQREAMEKLLVYYENHQEKEKLSRWLEKTDYSRISDSFRKTLMDYYMEVGMMENAFFGIELYGSEMLGAAKRLRLASFGIHSHQEKKDEVTLALSYMAFIRKKCNRDTLSYLMAYFCGGTEELLAIWERAKTFGLETSDFERRILEQVMFTGNDTDGVFPVLVSFYETCEGEEIIGRYLEYASEKERRGTMELTEQMHYMIGQEIVAGRLESQSSRIHYLYYFAGKQEWYPKIRETVVQIIETFLKEAFYLPIYHAYRQWVDFPVYYREMSFLTFRGQAGNQVVLTYQIEGEEDISREKTLEEVLPGMYVCHMHFFQKDHVKYRLEANGILVEDEKALSFETFAYEEGTESRFFALNRLDSEEISPEELKTYLIKAFFVDQYAKLL